MRVTLVLLCLIIAALAERSVAAGEQVYVIAESVSTSIEARRIAQQQQWIIVPLRHARYALVVVRSELEHPLGGLYSNVFEIKKDAEMQLNIAGSNFVVYLFELDDNFRPTQLRRQSYRARD
jgi:hypothetical protein